MVFFNLMDSNLTVTSRFKQSYMTRIPRLVNLDAHVLSTLLFRGWALCAGVFTMLLVPLCLPAVHQGFYFTFNSLVSIQIFFELGFNHVVSQIVSHEASLLNLAADRLRQKTHASKLASVRQLATRWYRVMAMLFAPVVFFSGAYFFHSQKALPMTEWMIPWGLLSVASALNLYVSPQLSIIEGLGRVDRVAMLRLLQSIFGNIIMWMLLLAHTKLWATIAVPLVASVMSLMWVRYRAFVDAPNALRDVVLPMSGLPALTWRRDILPLQWRIALSWVSGYFIFQTFIPLIFMHQGAVVAGRAGFGLSACTSIMGLGMSWVNAKSPMMSSAIASGDRVVLNKMFVHVFLRSSAFTALALTLLIGVAAAGQHAGLHFAKRIADTITMASLGLATLTNCVIGAMATYMRCHKEEPMLICSVVMAVLTLASVAWGSTVNAQLPFVLYAAVTLFIALPWTISIFLRYWRRLD